MSTSIYLASIKTPPSGLMILTIIFLALCVYDCYDAYRLGKRKCKPFLMPTLALLYALYSKTYSHPVNIFLIIGLLFGAAGDYFLIKKDEVSFLKGLIAFFINHVFYVLILYKEVDFSQFGTEDIITVLCYLIYIAIVMKNLIPHVDKEMKPPVFAYVTVIASMSFLAYMSHTTLTPQGFWFNFIGSLFFICSDSILAFQVFAGKSHVGVMSTYVTAQILIIIGQFLH